MKQKTIFLAAVFISFYGCCFSQSQETNVLEGRIVNAATGEPVSYATIQLPDEGINSMSNENGRFIFKIPARFAHDKIIITHVGYRPQTMVYDSANSTRLLITLQEAANELKEVEIKRINPLDLLKKAIGEIPKNYSTSPYRIGGFYRMTGWKDNRIIDLSEAVFDIYYANYSVKNSQFKLVKSRIDKDLTAFNGADNVSMGLDPAEIAGMDIVGGVNESDLLGSKGLREHDFKFRGLIDYNGQQAYEIEFDEKDGLKKALYKGKILLDADNLAFLEFDIGLSPKGVKYYDWGFFMKLMLNMAHVKADVLADNKIITYRKYGSKYYLNYANNTGRIYLAGGDRHFVFDPLVNKINFLVTRIDTGDIRSFQKDEILKSRNSIESSGKVVRDSRDGPYRSDTTDLFWENYNLIQAEFRVDSAVRMIQINNATLNYKEQLEKYLRKYNKDRIKGMDSILNFYYQKDRFNGVALIQQEGKVIYEKGFGMADREKQTVNTGQTQFRIGSTSKQFTSLLTMQLVSEHKLSVTDTIGKYIPGYVHGNITIQQLLTHQSGIPNYTANPDYYVKIMDHAYSPDELVFRFCSDSLEFDPGTLFDYSNSGYVILADIIEKITGKKYAELLSEKIFVPLGMKNSYFVSSISTEKLAKGYVNGQTEIPYPVDNVVGAGGITSTAEDLLLWANAIFSNQLLPSGDMSELFIPRVEWKEWDASYGYGWMMDHHVFQVSDKHEIRYHPGTEFGFYDMFVLQPDKRNVIILLNNTGDFPRFDMTDLILNELN
jgi:CubicO group peptidase (beta-lactamase class C family)